MAITITWQAEDVQVLMPDLTLEQAEDALQDVGGQLQDRSVEFGWDVLEVLLDNWKPAD
jgi:SepF-like predicted cell division protein (DUF552 family)